MSQLLASLLVWPVRLYQVTLSPLLRLGFGAQCRYDPSCSQYMIDALREWGAFRGLWMGTKRIGRCHPWGGHGDDPVPTNPKKQKHV